jgi:ribonuclease HI
VLETHSWTITFTWIKAHVGIYGNELADKLAMKDDRKDDISFNRTPKIEIAQQVRD